MIGTITHILAKAGYKAMNGPLADERRRLAGAVSPAAYVSYDPRLLAGAGWYGYRIALKGGDRSMLERARYMLEQQYTIRDSYEYYADGVYTFGVLLRQRVPHYGIGGGGATQEPDALNFYMPDGGTITLTRMGSLIDGLPTIELEYSIDGRATWQVWEEVNYERSFTLAAGQKMYVRNTSEMETIFSNASWRYYNFSSTGVVYADGDLRSLLCKNTQIVIGSNYCFNGLFWDMTYLLKAPSTLPAVNGTDVYNNTFRNTGIEESPLLVAQTLDDRYYRQLFFQCRSLKKVTTHMTDISANNCIYYWLYDVSPTGDFYCPAELTIPTDVSGIPSGWTRHDI